MVGIGVVLCSNFCKRRVLFNINDIGRVEAVDVDRDSFMLYEVVVLSG